MKLHIGAGTVYLDGWHNLDLRGPSVFEAKARPDLVEKWKTDESNYYGRHSDVTIETLRQGAKNQEYVCDQFGSFLDLSIPAWSVTEVLARHAFEHLSLSEAHRALDNLDEVMVEGGILRLDVPDHEATLKAYKETGDEFYVRHLLGPRRNEYGFHMMSYTPERLRNLVESHGFVFEAEEPNIHVYPAFCLRFRKPAPRVAWQYADMPTISDAWEVLEVGPGMHPWPRADVYLDKELLFLTPLSNRGKSTVVADLETHNLESIRDKRFDFCFAAHILEHVSNPEVCAAKLNRISKRGMAVVPSFAKEALGWFEETDHKFVVVPSPNGAVFVRQHSEFVNRLRDPEMQRMACHQFRSGPNRRGELERYSRKFWYQNERYMDLVITWDENRPLTIRTIE